MRLFCRDPHEKPDRCPPHEFEAAWQGLDEQGDPKGGVIYCRTFGDIRELEPAAIAAPSFETLAPRSTQ